MKSVFGLGNPASLAHCHGLETAFL
jgi:hypothetical protein